MSENLQTLSREVLELMESQGRFRLALNSLMGRIEGLEKEVDRLAESIGGRYETTATPTPRFGELPY